MPNQIKQFAIRIYFCAGSFLILTLLLYPGNSIANIYHVTQMGNDRNSGLTWESAWRTLKHAGKMAKAGDTVIIKAGDKPYKYLPIMNSGTKDNPIIFKGESATDKPVITGARQVKNWSESKYPNVWMTGTAKSPDKLLEDGSPLKMATNPSCLDGNWYWFKKLIYYKPTSQKPENHQIWKSFAAGGAVIRSQSWIEIHNLHFWFGGGAGVSIKNGHHIKLNNIVAEQHWRGIDISYNSSYNTIDNCHITNNRTGIYLRNGVSHNTVRRCLVTKNGNPPSWHKGDRAGIAIGDKGPNMGNIIEDNEISYNGGSYSDPGLIAYDAPDTILRQNNVHNNFGPGLFVTIGSHNTLVIDNKIISNGIPATQLKLKGMSGLSIRHSHNVVVKNNQIIDNHVSSDSRWPGAMLGPKGGIDVRGHPGQDMTNIQFINNIVSDTVGGPNFYIDRKANLSGLIIIPLEQAPDWYQQHK